MLNILRHNNRTIQGLGSKLSNQQVDQVLKLLKCSSYLQLTLPPSPPAVILKSTSLQVLLQYETAERRGSLCFHDLAEWKELKVAHPY